MDTYKLIVVCLLTLTFALSSASDQNGTDNANLEDSSLPEELKSDNSVSLTTNLEDGSLPEELKSDKSDAVTLTEENTESDGVKSDTGPHVVDDGGLNPEDEDMAILKIEELGGILNEEDIAEIVEEQATADLEDKQDIPEKDEDLRFEPIPMPTNFESYDTNDDGLIDLAELEGVTEAYENAEEVFRICDTNGNGFIDREEFKVAPLALAGKQPEVGTDQL